MPVSPARAAAFDILLRVERDSSYASELLHSAAYQTLRPADHALATELVMGILRWRSRLDHEIAHASSQPLPKLDLEVLIALRLALYQFRWLDRIPPRAALHESVELARRARKRSAAPFVNAVLRKLSIQKAVPDDLSIPVGHLVSTAVDSFSPQSLAAGWAHPLWLVERWAGDYGRAATYEICGYNQSAPTTTIRLRTATAESELIDEGISLLSGAFLTAARRIQSGDITRTQAFRQGRVVIQDEASQLVAALAGDAPQCKSRILDCCAAPGGKTLAIADHSPNAEIVAVELHPHRARLMRKLLSASASDAAPRIHTLVSDSRHLPLSRLFDRILADVPCSGTGTLARNPEIKWRLTPEDFAELQERQLAILRSAMTHLAPGGRLIYSTCSLEREENEDVVAQAVAENNSFRLLDCRSAVDTLKKQGKLATSVDTSPLTRGPYLRTIPGIHSCDGFFAAILERR